MSTLNRCTTIAICLAALVAPRAVQALSLACTPMEDHYFFECHNEDCVALFRAMPVRENACEWRSVIEPIESWAANALLAEVGQREIPLEGVMQVSVLHVLAPLEREDEHWSQVKNSKIAFPQQSPEVVRAEWEALAAKQLCAARKIALLVWGLFIAVLAILIAAGRLVWLRGFRQEKGWTSVVVLAIGVQFLIAIACSIPAFVVYITGIGTMLPIALLAPVGFVLVTVELLALSVRRLSTRGSVFDS